MTTNSIKRMDGSSLNICEDLLVKIRAIVPFAFYEGHLDMEKFKALVGDDINICNERYVLNWSGNGYAFRVLQIPASATLKPVIDESFLTLDPFPKMRGRQTGCGMA